MGVLLAIDPVLSYDRLYLSRKTYVWLTQERLRA